MYKACLFLIVILTDDIFNSFLSFLGLQTGEERAADCGV
jgi:hypothetical protein